MLIVAEIFKQNPITNNSSFFGFFFNADLHFF